MAVFENSRYLRTSQSLYKDSPVLDIRDRFTFNVDKCDIYIWKEGDTLDGLAYKYYGNSALRWAILESNVQYRTEFDINSGDLILIPDYEEVVAIVNV